MNKVKLFNNILCISFISSFIILQSCSKTTISSKSYSAKKLHIEKLDFDYLTIKSNIEFVATNKTIKATALIRIKKDSIVWLNLTGPLGIQAVRGIITKDSVKIINKITKTFSLYTFEDISKKFQFPINYELIQAMIVGDMPKPLHHKNAIKLNNNHYVIKQNIENIGITNFINQQTMKLEEVNVIEKGTDNSLKILYKNIKEIHGQGLPFSIFISLIHYYKLNKLKTQLNINHIKVEYSKKNLRFPFSIPKKYETQK